MVQLRQRLRGIAAARRVRRRTIGGIGDEAQPATSTPSCDRRHRRTTTRRATWLVAHRHSADGIRTYVRRLERRGLIPAGTGSTAVHPDLTGARIVGVKRGRLLRLVDWYQRDFEGRPSPCRFTPSCSSYAREALETHGSRRGLWLIIRRLARCRPFGSCGFDPVPLPAHDRRRPCPSGSAATTTGSSLSATSIREGSMTQ